MKASIKHLAPLRILIPGLGLILAGTVTAQTFMTLHNFPPPSSPCPCTNGDGVEPSAELVLKDNTLYGTTSGGGSSSYGTVFKVNADGTGFMTLYSFTNGSGAYPSGGLILSDSTLYGTTYAGGSGIGTVFKLNTNGTGFTVLYNFPGGSDGSEPSGRLILSGNILYGTTRLLGISEGTVFKVNTDGTGFTNLYSFTATSGGPLSTNSDGANPSGGLILSGSTLYGTAALGGSSGNGTVFKVNTNGTGFATVHSLTGSDGASPNDGLILSDTTLYGTAELGGSSGNGTVFKVHTDGSGFTILHSFSAGIGSFPFNYTSGSFPYYYTNTDGAGPSAGLVLSGNTLYGTTFTGGSSGDGTVFAVNTDGTGFMTLHRFSTRLGFSPYGNSDGLNPSARLILLGNTLYGTASGGGSGGWGTVFSILLPVPQLTILPYGSNGVLTWPVNYAEFDYTAYILQSTTNLGSSAVWNTVSARPLVIGGQNIVISTLSGSQQFFRLSQ